MKRSLIEKLESTGATKEEIAVCVPNYKLDRAWLDLVDEMCEKYGVESAQVEYLLKPAAVVSLLKFDKSSDVRKSVIDKIIKLILENEHVTAKDVDFLIYENRGYVSKPTKSKKPMKKLNLRSITLPQRSSSSILTSKIKGLSIILTPGEFQALRELAIYHDKDNELAVISYLIADAKRRMVAERGE
jgi:hypothetical protein